MEQGTPIPVKITVFSDRSFTFEMRTPPASFFLKKAAKITAGLGKTPGRDVAGRVTMAQVREIAEVEAEGPEHRQLRSGRRTIAGSARSMGLRWWSKAWHDEPRRSGKALPAASAAREGVDRDKLYTLDEAVKLVKSRAKAKFDETIEVAMNLGVDPKHADQLVRGVCNLPNGSGRTLARRRVRARRQGRRGQGRRRRRRRRRGSGRAACQKGTINFDRCIATPDMMGLVGRLGKVLGPRGLMPNPRVGTVTMDVATAVKGAKGGAVEFRVEKAGIVHAGVGKASFTGSAGREHQGVRRRGRQGEAAGAKGTYVKKVSISSTMGPGVKIDTARVRRRLGASALSRSSTEFRASEGRRMGWPRRESASAFGQSLAEIWVRCGIPICCLRLSLSQGPA